MTRTMTGAAALVAATLMPCLAEARPADCLVQIEGHMQINGTCEFSAEPNGDFSVTLGSRTARVMVDPGSREGRATFEDTASGEPPGVADVQREGACWVQPAVRICAWQPGQRPAAFRNAAAAVPATAAASQAPAATGPAGARPDARVVSSRQIGPWTLWRIEAPGGWWACEVERRYPDGSTLVFLARKGNSSQSVAETGFRFGAPALQGQRGEISVRPWATSPGDPLPNVTATADGQGFATMMDPTDEPGSSDGFANGRELGIGLPGGTTLRYALQGSNAAWRGLAQCAGF